MGRQYVPPSKAVLGVLSNPAKSKSSPSGFLDQRSQSDSDMAVTVCVLLLLCRFTVKMFILFLVLKLFLLSSFSLYKQEALVTSAN